MLSLQKKNTAYGGVFFFLVTEKKLSANIYGRKEIINPKKKKFIINLDWSKFYLILIKKNKTCTQYFIREATYRYIGKGYIILVILFYKAKKRCTKRS